MITATAPAKNAAKSGTSAYITATKNTSAHCAERKEVTEMADTPQADTPQIRVINTKRACEILADHGMKTDPNKIGLGLQQKVYPFGVAIHDKRWIYEIYENLLLDWISERSS